MATAKSTASKTPAAKKPVATKKPEVKAPAKKPAAKKPVAPAKAPVAAKATVKAPAVKKAAAKAKAKPEVDLSKYFAALVENKLTVAQRNKLKEEAKRRKVTVTALTAAILAAFIEQL